MAGHVDDSLKNSGRREMTPVIGLLEGVEATGLQMETKSGQIKIERVHRTLAPKPDEN